MSERPDGIGDSGSAVADTVRSIRVWYDLRANVDVVHIEERRPWLARVSGQRSPVSAWAMCIKSHGPGRRLPRRDVDDGLNTPR